MKTPKAPSTTASKSTVLTDATKSKVSILNPDFIMKSDNSINSTNTVNATNSINSDNTVNSATPANADNLFDNEQTVIEQPKQQRIGKQQRKSDFAEFKATFLAPAKLVNRHALNIEGDLWNQLERVSRILGDRGTTVSSYANAILAEHLKQYADDIEIWRKL